MGVEGRLTAAAHAAVNTHAATSFSRVASIRLAALLTFLGLCSGLALTGVPGWASSLPPLVLGTLFAAFVFAWRGNERVKQWGGHTFVFDVLLVYALQRAAMPSSPFPAGVAGFSLALFGVLVSLCAGTLQRGPTVAAVAVSAVCEVALMRQAGVGGGAQLAAMLVLAILGLAQTFMANNLKTMVASLAEREVAYRLERQRVAELENARAVIERMLEEAQARHDELLTLQQDKELLTSLIVHDLRAPLTSLRANAEFVKKELPPLGDADVRDAIDDVVDVTGRLAGMINDLLNISRLETNSLPLQVERVGVGEVLTQVKRHLVTQARARSIEVVGTTDNDLLIAGDRLLLTRTLENLTSNALRYTPRGGRLCVEARRSGDQVLIAVRNDGPVIAPAARDRLFDKFVQAGAPQHNRRAGWGLGLYFCKLSVQAHHGQIGLEDEPGWPTSFVVRLPAPTQVQLAA